MLPNRAKSSSDITYVPTDEGWLYLAGVMDAYSRRIVGYAVDEHMKTELVVQALAGASRSAPGLQAWKQG